jgi:hypothetical protein
MPWISVNAAIIAAGAANVEGDRKRTIASLRTAIERGDAENMALHSAAARYRLGTLLAGHEGRRLATEAQASLEGRGIRSVSRFVGMYFPGRWPEGAGS